uniref:RRM domain-containing protein n=1 Tax=Eutreptiella gymnastica TaxID=73025 RepID=A0A7S1HT60_9EUGL
MPPLDPETSEHNQEEEEEEEEGQPEDFEAKQKRLGAISDLDFLQMLKSGGDVDDAPVTAGEMAAADTPGDPDYAEGRLYITNLPYSTSEEDLEAVLTTHGALQSVHIPLTKETRQSKGVAFVQFAAPTAAVAAREALHESIFQGRLINVTSAKAQPAAVELQWSDSYKAKKAAKEKADRENAKRWNSLYINTNTVVDTIASRLNVNKDTLIGQDQDNAAVKLAIAESVLTAEASQVLSDEGVNLEVLNDKNRVNSKNTIIVKNLPGGAAGRQKGDILADLVKLFRTAGELGRVVAPEGTTLALIEFLEPADARKAFSKFAYYKFNDVPLFLEWAPVGLLAKKEKPADEEDADTTDGSSTLYVSNLPFSVTEPQVKSLFDDHANHIRSVSLKSAKGYAFVEFTSPAAAAKAAAAVPKREVEGREVAVSVSKAKKKAAPAPTSRKGECPPGCNPLKLVVRNVPFEGTAADIRKLFSAHAQIKSVRLPKKVDEYDPLTGTKAPHRGFAFVEFLTREEAKAALQTCSNTHLYGRHLVIEYAADNTSVDSLRDKASRKSLADLPTKPAKRKKLELGNRGE